MKYFFNIIKKFSITKQNKPLILKEININKKINLKL